MTKWTIPLGGLSPRCARCLFACVQCSAVQGDLPRARRMTRLVEDIVRGELEWFPGWRTNEMIQSEED